MSFSMAKSAKANKLVEFDCVDAVNMQKFKRDKN